METLKLEPEHILPYLAHNLKVQIDVKYSEKYTRTLTADLIGVELFKSGTQYTVKPYDVHGRQWDTNLTTQSLKPLLLPLSELTDEQWRIVFGAGKEDILHYENVFFERHANGIEIILPGYKVCYDYENNQFDSGVFMFNQRAAFRKLCELHADLDFLINKGLAISKV